PRPISPCWLTLFQGLDAERIVLEIDLDTFLADRRFDIVAGAIEAGNGDQLGLQALAEDAGLRVAIDPGERPAAHPALDMDIAPGDELGARAYRGDDHQVTIIGEDPLAGAYRLGDQQRAGALAGRHLARRRRWRRAGGHRLLVLGRQLAAALERDQPGAERR